MKLVWSHTGDELEIVPTNTELAEYYVHALAVYNSFSCTDNGIDTDKAQHLLLALDDINQFLTQHKIATAFAVGDPYDQRYLNELHRNWVKFNISTPKFVQLLKLTEPALIPKFRSINKLLHYIEEMFTQQWTSVENNEVALIDNPFEHALSHDMANVQIVYHNLGRNTFNKWANFDDDLDVADTNDFSQLATEIEINLARPAKYTAPIEYIDWCGHHDLPVPPGRWLNLGNIKNLQHNLTEYRNILIRNSRFDMRLVI
jgi:hypothetical protein